MGAQDNLIREETLSWAVAPESTPNIHFPKALGGHSSLLQFRGWHFLFWQLSFYLLFFFLKPKIHITSGKADFVKQTLSCNFLFSLPAWFVWRNPLSSWELQLEGLLLPPSTPLVKADSLARRQLPPVTKVPVIPTRLLGWLTSVQQETLAPGLGALWRLHQSWRTHLPPTWQGLPAYERLPSADTLLPPFSFRFRLCAAQFGLNLSVAD